MSIHIDEDNRDDSTTTLKIHDGSHYVISIDVNPKDLFINMISNYYPDQYDNILEMIESLDPTKD